MTENNIPMTLPTNANYQGTTIEFIYEGIKRVVAFDVETTPAWALRTPNTSTVVKTNQWGGSVGGTTYQLGRELQRGEHAHTDGHIKLYNTRRISNVRMLLSHAFSQNHL